MMSAPRTEAEKQDENKDSLRIYYLGNNWERHIEHFGIKETYNPEGVLIV